MTVCCVKHVARACPSLFLAGLTPPCKVFSLEKATRTLLTETQRVETSWRTVMIVVFLSSMTLHSLCWVQVRLNRQVDHHSRFEWPLDLFSSEVHKDNERVINRISLNH